MPNKKNKIRFSLTAINSLAASIFIISFILVCSCTKRECRGSVARPVLKLRIKKEYFGAEGTIIGIKDTFLRITSIQGIGSVHDSLLIKKPDNSKDSLNILSLPLSPIHDTTSFIIAWKDSNTATPLNRKDRIKFSYTRYQVQTSELCGFTYYFKNLDTMALPLKPYGFIGIDIVKPTVDLVNDTIHAYLYLK